MWHIRAQSLHTCVHFAVAMFHILKELATNGCCPTSPVAASHEENDSVSSVPLTIDSQWSGLKGILKVV